jgi:pimeloyl-ACP methyl ester carboxylesterase
LWASRPRQAWQAAPGCALKTDECIPIQRREVAALAVKLLGLAAIVGLLLYGGIAAIAFVYQGRLLFPAPPERAAMPRGGERLFFDAPDGVRLVGIRFAPAHLPAAAPLLLGFGGNGWNADDAGEYLHGLYPEAEVIAFHYRGYPPSGGAPRTRELEGDALRLFDFAAARAQGRAIVAVGFSIGSGVAAHLAAHRPVAGAILVTPFDSLTAVAAGQLRWLPVRLLFHNPMEPAAALRGKAVPVAILAGGADDLVRPERTDALRAGLANSVYDRTIRGAGHNDIYGRSDFHEAMRAALAAVLRAQPPQG